VFCASHPSKVALGSSASSSVGPSDDDEVVGCVGCVGCCEGEDADVDEGPSQIDDDGAMGLDNGSGDAPADIVGA
jgi:hypothetical protein